MAAPGIKVEGNGLRKAVPEAWVGDRPWWKTTVHLLEGAEAEEVAPKPDDPRYSIRSYKKTWMKLAATPS